MIKNAEITVDLIPKVWRFTLYVCGETPKSIKTYASLKKVCTERLGGHYTIEVVDLIKNPALAISNNIMACPTIVKESPLPKRIIIGDLSKLDIVTARLDFPEEPLISAFSRGAKSVSFSNQGSNMSALFDFTKQLHLAWCMNLR